MVNTKSTKSLFRHLYTETRHTPIIQQADPGQKLGRSQAPLIVALGFPSTLYNLIYVITCGYGRTKTREDIARTPFNDCVRFLCFFFFFYYFRCGKKIIHTRIRCHYDACVYMGVLQSVFFFFFFKSRFRRIVMIQSYEIIITLNIIFFGRVCLKKKK